ncbi:MAG TPA: O-antigen polymerase [Croceicoccus sp.]|nr:O-antigen polymerase [Croceicoccus sp.]
MYPVLLIANTLLWLGYCTFLASRRYFSVYHPAIFYLFFHGLVFVVRPIYVYLIGYTDIYYLYEFMPTASDKVTVMLGTMLALIVMMQTLLMTANAPVRPSGSLVKEAHRNELLKPFLLLALICVPIALYSLNLRFESKIMGTSDMVRDAATGIAINTTSSGYMKDAHFMLIPICALFAWLMRFKWWSVLPFVFYVIICASTGSRWPFMIGSASLAMLYMWDRRRILPSTPVLVASFMLLTLFALVGQDRGKSMRTFITEGNVAVSDYDATGAGGTLAGMDFAGLEYFEYIVYVVPQRSDTYGYFLSNLQVLTEPIPRTLWSGKPIGPPIQLYNLFDYGYPIGMSNTLPGEGWAQLGYFGIVIWCALWGFLLGKFYTNFTRKSETNFTPLYYLLIIPHSLTFFRDGMLLTFVKTSFFFLVPVILLQIAARWMIPSLNEIGHGLSQYRARQKQGAAAPEAAIENGAESVPDPAPPPRLTPRQRRQELARRWHG